MQRCLRPWLLALLSVLGLVLIVFLLHQQWKTGVWLWEDPDIALRGWRPSRTMPIMFLHLHKAAGTTLCELARLNGEKMLGSSTPQNCNLQLDGTAVNRGRIPPRFQTCSERADFLLSRGISFNAVEHFLDGTDSEPLCNDRLYYMTIMREPLQRLHSLCSFSRWNGTELVKWATMDDPTTEMFVHHVDNYYIRTLGGSEIFHRPRGSIGLAELKKAESVLSQFSSVIPLDELNERLPSLLADLDWSTAGIIRAENPTPQSNREKYFITEEQADLLAAINHWDIRLWKSLKANRI